MVGQMQGFRTDQNSETRDQNAGLTDQDFTTKAPLARKRRSQRSEARRQKSEVQDGREETELNHQDIRAQSGRDNRQGFGPGFNHKDTESPRVRTLDSSISWSLYPCHRHRDTKDRTIRKPDTKTQNPVVPAAIAASDH